MRYNLKYHAQNNPDMFTPQISFGGFVPFSSLDFPGQLSAVLFCQGCPWRCRYCHNTHLLDFHAPPTFLWEHVENFLKRRRKLLDAVVFSGGEPLLQKHLIEAIQRVRDLGFKVGLQTAGPSVKKLAQLLPYLDWVGLDIKAPFKHYAKVTQVSHSGQQPLESAQLILQAGIPYEFRTTVHSSLLSENDLLELAHSLAHLGAKHYILQECRLLHCLDLSLRNYPSYRIDRHFIETLQKLIPEIIVR